MKKSLIALAVAAGTIAAAQADTTTLYGSLGYSSVIGQTNLDAQDGIVDNGRNIVKSVKDTHWDINTATAKLGVKGTEDLDNGLQAFYKFEFGTGEPTTITSDDKTPVLDQNGKPAKVNDGLSKLNYAYIGLKGDFGTFTIGRQKTLFKTVTDTGLFQEVGVTTGKNYPGVANKVISYVSPASGGLQLGASVVADSSDFSSKGVDAWEVAAMYKINGFDTGLVYSHDTQGARKDNGATGKAEIIDQGSSEYLGLNVGYSTEQYGIMARALHASSVGTDYGIEGEYKTGPNTFRAGFGVNDPNANGADNTYQAALGYQYNFSNRTYTWVEGQYTDYNNDNKDNGFKALVGIRHDF